MEKMGLPVEEGQISSVLRAGQESIWKPALGSGLLLTLVSVFLEVSR